MSSQKKEPSIFTKIINGEIPSEFVYQDEKVVAIRDINPQAAFHVLIVTREPLGNVYLIDEDNVDLAGHMLLVAAKIARQEKITNGFRLIINNGIDANQEVMHLHMHMLAGQNLGAMTCIEKTEK